MIDHGVALPSYRLHVVPAVVALASPAWQRDVWLDPDQHEDLDHIVHALFDDFCNADDPQPWLGQSLRTEQEVELMARLGTAYGAVQDAVGRRRPGRGIPGRAGVGGRGDGSSRLGPGAGRE
ncbi:SCO4402 family protein [Streptomyces sp. Sge12]|uniref:SCO4402 family protein n=1 Tax=Streptomyces sp. Sge12 TaxID=1972846 RepID=UPI001F1FF28D|nr:hypothetical protein [Streptomyces sp. Sge12]